jgi:hypothetical protein
MKWLTANVAAAREGRGARSGYALKALSSIQIERHARHPNHPGRPTTSRTNSGNRDEIVENPPAARRFLTFEIRHRYTALLIFIAIWLTVLPFLAGDTLAIFSMRLVFSVILLCGIYAGRRTRWDLIVGGVLGISALFGRWLPQYSTDMRMFLAIDILTVVFLLYITITILNQIHSTHRVTLDTLAGALCAYCLIGLMWASVYRAIFAFNPRFSGALNKTAARAGLFECAHVRLSAKRQWSKSAAPSCGHKLAQKLTDNRERQREQRPTPRDIR